MFSHITCLKYEAGMTESVDLGATCKSDLLLSAVFLCVGYICLIVFLSFCILWSEQQKDHDNCIFSKVVFVYSHIPTLNSKSLPLFLALSTWRLKEWFFYEVIVLWANVCMYCCVWDEPLRVPYLQAKKQLLSFCVCVFGKSWCVFLMFCIF